MSRNPGVWWDKMWNPVTGCTPISPGCKNCWAMRDTKRWRKSFVPGLLHPDRFDAPFHWRKPRVVFVCGWGDLFHEEVSLSFHRKVFDIMRRCLKHTFVLLTKRADIMAFSVGRFDPLPNVLCGVSACTYNETAQHADDLHSMDGQGWRTLLCMEPLLEPIPITHGELRSIHQVIVGCESGMKGKRRSMKDDWVRDIRDTCRTGGVPFYLKQAERNGKVVGEPELDGLRHTNLSGIMGT